MNRLKPLLRWLILGAALFFVAATVRAHWQEVAAIQLTVAVWRWLAIALLTTLLAHVWAGAVWGWILRELGLGVPLPWATQTYLITNLAKYLPGNVWHFYGRVWAAREQGAGLAIAILSVVLEPLLMAASALMVGLVGLGQVGWEVQALSLAIALCLVHPRLLNPVLQKLSRQKANAEDRAALAEKPLGLQRYPFWPLFGELLFLGLRGLGFLWIVVAFVPLAPSQILPVLSAFSIAWLLGLVVPGAPGGIGVFEAVAIALLPSSLTPAIILSSVACYRLVSTLAEALGAALGWLWKRLATLP